MASLDCLVGHLVGVLKHAGLSLLKHALRVPVFLLVGVDQDLLLAVAVQFQNHCLLQIRRVGVFLFQETQNLLLLLLRFDFLRGINLLLPLLQIESLHFTYLKVRRRLCRHEGPTPNHHHGLFLQLDLLVLLLNLKALPICSFEVCVYSRNLDLVISFWLADQVDSR